MEKYFNVNSKYGALVIYQEIPGSTGDLKRYIGLSLQQVRTAEETAEMRRIGSSVSMIYLKANVSEVRFIPLQNTEPSIIFKITGDEMLFLNQAIEDLRRAIGNTTKKLCDLVAEWEIDRSKFKY
jgi:hypothetical protein